MCVRSLGWGRKNHGTSLVVSQQLRVWASAAGGIHTLKVWPKPLPKTRRIKPFFYFQLKPFLCSWDWVLFPFFKIKKKERKKSEFKTNRGHRLEVIALREGVTWLFCLLILSPIVQCPIALPRVAFTILRWLEPVNRSPPPLPGTPPSPSTWAKTAGPQLVPQTRGLLPSFTAHVATTVIFMRHEHDRSLPSPSAADGSPTLRIKCELNVTPRIPLQPDCFFQHFPSLTLYASQAESSARLWPSGLLRAQGPGHMAFLPPSTPPPSFR